VGKAFSKEVVARRSQDLRRRYPMKMAWTGGICFCSAVKLMSVLLCSLPLTLVDADCCWPQSGRSNGTSPN